MNTDIAKKRANQVLRIDSIDSTDSDFLATHVPFRKIVVSTKSGDQYDESYKSEEDIFKDIFDNELTHNEHQFIIVEGSSGAGKSHFIRWLYALLSAKEEKKDVVLLIRRSDNTLKGTIRQLLDIKEVKEISNKDAYERLVKANQAISENKFKSTIYHQFIVEIENDTNEVLGNIKRKKLIALLNNSTFQERMMETGGPIDRIYSKITNLSSNVDLDIIAQFNKSDLTLDIDFINQLEDADRKAQDFANGLIEGDDEEFIQKITDYLNSFVETVIQTSAGIEPGDFQQIFKEIRQELKRKGKDLILLVEDITSFTGVNQALLNALVTGHTGSNSVDNLCKIISVVGTTTQYYNQFRDNYRDRITKQITIHDGVIGEKKSDLIQFVAKYLNAISLSGEVLDEWVRNGAYSDDMPVHEDTVHDHWDKFKLGSGKQISLFPFTQKAIINLYDAMADHKTPRYILRDIIEPAVNEVIYDISSFPKFCVGWRSSISEPVENRIGNIVQSLQLPQEQKVEYRKRLVTFISFWTDKTLDVTSNGCISGINKKIFRELDFGNFVSKLTSTATVKHVPTHVSAAATKSESAVKTENVFVETPVDVDDTLQTTKLFEKEQPKIDPKNQKEYDSFKKNVIAWHRDGGKLIRFIPIRDQIGAFVYDAINWQQEGVPLDSKKKFEDAVKGRLIGFERQDQAIDRCVVIFPDTDETYQLLLCFGKWLYLGNKSWNFPDSASAIYFATSWLQRNKDKFVNAVKNVEKGLSIPAYIKAAMIEKVYKLILNGKIGNTKLNSLGDETFLEADSSQNTAADFSVGHTKAWYDLHQFIYSAPQTDGTYTASVRYFNLIQGVTLNTESYVLNYSLYRAALKEIHKSGYVLSESDLDIEKGIKDKHEIVDFTQKILSKVHKVVEEEIELARITAENVLSYFDNIDMEDEIEASDIRNIINEIYDFYQKAYAAQINLGSVDKNKFDAVKNAAPNIAKAMVILQKDHSNEDDISVLYAFSSNPVGVVQPFLYLLRRADKDIDISNDKMQNEKELLTRKGNWNDNIDPRFEAQQDDFQKIISDLEEA